MFRSMGLLFRRIPVRRAYGRTRLVDRIGLVLDDPKGFESAWRSFVPETP